MGPLGVTAFVAYKSQKTNTFELASEHVSHASMGASAVLDLQVTALELYFEEDILLFAQKVGEEVPVVETPATTASARRSATGPRRSSTWSCSRSPRRHGTR